MVVYFKRRNKFYYKPLTAYKLYTLLGTGINTLKMEILVKILGVVALVVGMAFLFTLPVMWLWNALMPDIFGLVEIGFWQALGLSLLSGFLFKSSNSSSKN